jgi:Putative zinc-finger/WD40-like Beta Propeller Repeat
MTFDRDRHTPFEELISASLHGDLTADERRRLDAHLDACATCRATLAAFSDQRRVMSGLRHVPVPRDLGARVRAGIEQHTEARPWWKRPPAIFAGVGGGLAVVAGALLALVLLNNNPDDSNVGQISPSPVASTAGATPVPTLPPLETPAPTEPPASVAASESAPPPTATPVQASPEPDSYLAVTGPPDNQAMTVVDAETDTPVAEAPAAVPIAAELSPDGQWIAYIVELGLSGNTEIRATRIAEGTPSDDPDALPPVDSPVAVGDTITLAESVSGSPFVEHLFWSSNSQYLAFTAIDREEGGGTDVWIFQPAHASTSRATDVGNAYAGSWVPGSSGTSLLWVSTAGETPQSHLRAFHDGSSEEITAADPDDSDFPAADNVFQPILSPDGALVIFWNGSMSRSGQEWVFETGGQPWLAENRPEGDQGYRFDENQPVFSDLTIEQDAFTSAAVRWSLDSNAFAVWDTDWAGISQGADGQYPDRRRVYLGRAFEPTHVTEDHALDVGDVPEDTSVVDVKVAGTGRHLAITARKPVAGDLSTPEAVLLLVQRNFEDVADDVVTLGQGEGQWYGPAVYSAADWAELIGE